MTDESRHGLRISRPSAGVFCLVAPVVAVGVDVVAAEDVVVVFADDGDGGGGHQDQDRGGGVVVADAEVVQAAAVAQGEFAELVDGVVADAEVSIGVCGGLALGRGCRPVRGWCPAEGAVGSLGVVDDGEVVQQGLHCGDSGGAGSRRQPAFEGLVEAFDFALGLGVFGVAVFLGDAQAGQQTFEVVVAVGES